MFFHLLGSRLKCLLRDKETIFWTMLFPIVLSTMFYFGFGNLMNGEEQFTAIPVAVVDNAAYQKNTGFQETLKAVSSDNDDPLLKVTVVSQEEAQQLLKDGKADGIITVGDKIELTVSKSGLNQSIVKSFLDQYAQTSSTLTNLISQNPSAAKQLVQSLSSRQSYTQEITLSGAKPNTMLNYFYALIAMACLYGSFFGLRNTTDIQADLSPQGARRCMAPTHKLKSVLSDTCAALIINFSEILILICYLAFALKIDFGQQVGYVILTCFVGSLTGVSYGTLVGSAIKKREGLKIGILIGLTMLLSFLSGLMFPDMKYMIAHNAPVLSYINPAALVTDAFYCLYIYQSHARYFLNIGILCGISALFCLVSYFIVRRQKYASL